HTHAAKSELTMTKLSQWANTITLDATLVNNIKASNTARHAFSFIYPEFPDVISHVGKKIIENAEKFAAKKLTVRSIIFDFDGNPIFDSYHL
ncbi:MAG: cobalamin biosynthesis protein CbiD, partial [Desulfobacteraceae bacterium]|nr:cobalamin biosynthesis protein CbiD [Desulfobacteraceae bacterium]